MVYCSYTYSSNITQSSYGTYGHITHGGDITLRQQHCLQEYTYITLSNNISLDVKNTKQTITQNHSILMQLSLLHNLSKQLPVFQL